MAESDAVVAEAIVKQHKWRRYIDLWRQHPKVKWECPIPRCAIEVYLAIDAIFIGMGIESFGDMRLGMILIFRDGFTLELVRGIWAAMLISVGVLQLLAVKFGGFRILRFAALLAALVWMMYCYTTWVGHMRSTAMPHALVNIGAQLYLYWLLRGGKWAKS